MQQNQSTVDSLHVLALTYQLIWQNDSLWVVEGGPISDMKWSSLKSKRHRLLPSAAHARLQQTLEDKKICFFLIKQAVQNRFRSVSDGWLAQQQMQINGVSVKMTNTALINASYEPLMCTNNFICQRQIILNRNNRIKSFKSLKEGMLPAARFVVLFREIVHFARCPAQSLCCEWLSANYHIKS